MLTTSVCQILSDRCAVCVHCFFIIVCEIFCSQTDWFMLLIWSIHHTQTYSNPTKFSEWRKFLLGISFSHLYKIELFYLHARYHWNVDVYGFLRLRPDFIWDEMQPGKKANYSNLKKNASNFKWFRNLAATFACFNGDFNASVNRLLWFRTMTNTKLFHSKKIDDFIATMWSFNLRLSISFTFHQHFTLEVDKTKQFRSGISNQWPAMKLSTIIYLKHCRRWRGYLDMAM